MRRLGEFLALFIIIVSLIGLWPDAGHTQAILGGGGGGGGAAAVADITTGLLNDWNFETSLTADDGSEGTTITWTNSPTLRTDGCAVGSQCVELDGSTQHGAADITFPTSGDFTFAVWAYLDGIGGADYIFAGHNGSSSVAELALFWDNEGDLSVFADAFTTERFAVFRSVVYTVWHHLAVTREDGVLKLWMNGHLIDTGVLDATLGFSTCDLLIGTEADSGCASTLGNYFDGRLDDILRYNRALSETDIDALVAEGS